MPLERKKFAEVDLSDPFFDSLKADYLEFSDWFAAKAEHEAYVFYDDAHHLQGFLYLKVEDEEIGDVTPPLPARRRLKVGTFKIIPHGTRLGERFVKKIFDHAVEQSIDEVYVTIFQKHEALVALLSKYGFRQAATKTTKNGEELVLVKKLHELNGDIIADYPVVDLRRSRSYLLSIYPKWHTKLFPDSILKTEHSSIIEDISHTNSIHKVYLASMNGMEALRPGDVLAIYRTTDIKMHAYYRSVVTSFCVLEEYRTLSSFSDAGEFFQYCRPYSVFTEEELAYLWKSQRYQHVIRFTYNVALPKRPNRKALIEEVGINQNAYAGFMPLTAQQTKQIAKLGGVDESLIVD